jgi:hypothetical protein
MSVCLCEVGCIWTEAEPFESGEAFVSEPTIKPLIHIYGLQSQEEKLACSMRSRSEDSTIEDARRVELVGLAHECTAITEDTEALFYIYYCTSGCGLRVWWSYLP